MPPRRLILPGFHPSAGTWLAAGNRFTKLRMVPPLPISAYRNKITGVPLTGGQASGLIGGFSALKGSATSPPAFTTLAGSGSLAPGIYVINWSVTLTGTLSGAEVNNFILFGGPGGNTVLATSVNPAAPGTYPQPPVTRIIAAGDTTGVASGAVNATAGAVYSGTFSSLPPLTLTAGPQGLGTTWYPAQVTVSTTTGVLDSSTAQVYLGIGGVPTMLAAAVFSGNGTAAVAIPAMQPGESVIVTWTNGHPGDTASFNVIGTMDALTTGRG
jgi:hypothetical protein